MKVYQLWTEGTKLMSEFGPPTGTELADVVLVGVSLVASCSRKRQAVCGFAQRHMRGGIAYVTRDGHFVIQNATKKVAYELFPAVTQGTNTHVYLGVKRAEDAW